MDTDVIAEIRYAFARLKNRENLSKTERESLRKQYYAAEGTLKKFIERHQEWRIHTFDDFTLLLDMFFSEIEIAQLYEDIEKYAGKTTQCLEYCIDNVYLKKIYEIAKSLLTFRDGKIAIRTWINEDDETDIFRYPNVFDKIEVWNLLGRMVTTDLFVVAFFVEAELTDVFYLYNQTGGILLADKTLEKVLQRGMAETHMHFNAGVEFTYLWQKRMDLRKWEKKLISEEKYKEFCALDKATFQIMIYRLLWAEYMEAIEDQRNISFKEFITIMYPEHSEILEELLHHMLLGDMMFYSSEWKKQYSSFLVVLTRRYSLEKETNDLLMDTVYKKYQKYHTYSEMIFLFKSLQYFKNRVKDAENRHLFLQYIRSKNLYYRNMVQSNQTEGLVNFQQYFSQMSDQLHKDIDTKSRYDIIFKSIAHNTNLRKLEVRVSPSLRIDFGTKDSASIKDEIRRGLLRDIKTILEVYKKNLLEAAGLYDCDQKTEILVEKMDIPQQTGKITFPTLGIVFHYIKQELVDNRIGDTCWVKGWEEIKKDSRHVLVWREVLVRNAKVLEELRSQMPLLGEYVVGIDAASEENKTEPWVFAPMYSAIRNRKITKPVLMDSKNQILKINNLGFTYHVGEEYRHLLSGFRHIDEVIKHFHYKAGDRLGHAIALGVDVKYWMEKNEVVLIPIQEHMENLLWLWGCMVHRGWGIEINSEALEGKILELAEMIYGQTDGLNVSMLYGAYIEKFKRNYTDKLDRMKEYISDADIENCKEKGINHFCKFYDINAPYGVMWTKDKVFCAYFCPVYYQRANRPIMVNVSKEEFELLKKIQDYMVREVEQIGIYVETNPTSNLSIGEINSLYTPPILNMNSKGLIEKNAEHHEILVTVNSDDPLVFNTNSENELAYIYHALGYQGYKKESVINWINKVRKMGMDSSFIKNEKKPSQQIREITELIQMINGLLKETNS